MTLLMNRLRVSLGVTEEFSTTDFCGYRRYKPFNSEGYALLAKCSSRKTKKSQLVDYFFVAWRAAASQKDTVSV
jgi:hypothetical protein